MELPHGVPVKNVRGPTPLADLNAALLKDEFTGYLRASRAGDALAEGVVVYDAGRPAMAFASDGKADRPDGGQEAVAAIVSGEDSVIEIVSLSPAQLRLLKEFGREFAILPGPAVAPAPAPAPAPAVRPTARAPAPGRGPQASREKAAAMPEVRGTFARAEEAESLRAYIESMADETGHVAWIGPDGAECHLLLVRGAAVAAYSSAGAGDALLERILPQGGTAELYRVDEALLESIIRMYPHVALRGNLAPEPPAARPSPEPPAARPSPEPPAARPSPEPPAARPAPPAAPESPAAPEPPAKAVLRPDSVPYVPLVKPEPIAKSEAMAHGTVSRPPEGPRQKDIPRFDATPMQTQGVFPKALFEKGGPLGRDGIGTPAPEAKHTESLKGDLDDDADFVRKVEKEFVGNVDDLLRRLDLSHLKVATDRKKRP